jgi:D-alanyl-D-alanine carboxypeptidase/D-alanyl-D-alanine-endopeptidase (penicillin-binding protein 4)
MIEVTGQVPAGGQPQTRQVSVDNPTLYFVRALKEALGARGIIVRGDAVDVDDLMPDDPAQREAAAIDGRSRGLADLGSAPRTLATWTSPPLASIGNVLMKVSQNLYAETLLKRLGVERGAGTTSNGRRVVEEVLSGWGVAPNRYAQVDGSGLSRYNYVSAGAIVAILRHMARDQNLRDSWMQALPVAGRDGTLSTRMRRSPVEGNVMAKTGTIANVRSLSGYVTTRDGELVAFSIIANNFILPAATIDYAAEIAVEFLASFTRR